MPLLPEVRTRAEYLAVFRKDAVCLQAVRGIADRHGLVGTELVRIVAGTNIVFYAGDTHVLKLSAPLFINEHRAELSLLSHVAGRLPVATPEVVAEGELEGWPYLIITRVPGVPLETVYESLDAGARIRVAQQLGGLAAVIHTLPFGPLADTWDQTYAELRAGCVERRRAQGLGEACLAALGPKLDAIAPTPGSRRVPAHADLTAEHIFVDGQGRIVALIDFADALVADPLYELPAIALFALQSDPAPIRAALRAYGFSATAINASLAETLTAFALLHRYGHLGEVPATANRRPQDWAEAVQMLVPIG